MTEEEWSFEQKKRSFWTMKVVQVWKISSPNLKLALFVSLSLNLAQKSQLLFRKKQANVAENGDVEIMQQYTIRSRHNNLPGQKEEENMDVG